MPLESMCSATLSSMNSNDNYHLETRKLGLIGRFFSLVSFCNYMDDPEKQWAL